MWEPWLLGLFNKDKGLASTAMALGQLGYSKIVGVLAYGILPVSPPGSSGRAFAVSGGYPGERIGRNEAFDISEHGMRAYPDFVSLWADRIHPCLALAPTASPWRFFAPTAGLAHRVSGH